MKTLNCAIITAGIVTVSIYAALLLGYPSHTVASMGACEGSSVEELDDRLEAVSLNLNRIADASGSPEGVPIANQAQTYAQAYPFENYSPRLAAVFSKGGHGTGFLIGGGYVVTVAHGIPSKLKYSQTGSEVSPEKGNVELIVGEKPFVGEDGKMGLDLSAGFAKEAKVVPDVALVYVPNFRHFNPDISFKLAKYVKEGDSITLLALHPSSTREDYPESEAFLPYTEISHQGHIRSVRNGKVQAFVYGEPGYSGSPVYKEGSVVGILKGGSTSRHTAIYTAIDKLGPLLASEKASLEACLANAPRN